MGIWSELENHVKIRLGTFGKCEHGIKSKIIKMIDEEKTLQFLTGLNDEIF